jgi:PAS domain S-box-containing protein
MPDSRLTEHGTVWPKMQARLWIVLVAAGLSVAIFVVDTVTHPDIIVAALYVVVVLLAARVLQPRGIVLVSVVCVVLTCLSALLAVAPRFSLIGVGNTLVSLTVLGLTTALILQSKSAESSLRRQAQLLDLTHDGIFIRDLEGKIRTWNRGAEELYGWTAKEAIGAVAQQLLRTVFPVPWERIEAELLATGRWEGELRHSRKDGTQVLVDSRWSLKLDEAGNPVGYMETNNDITQRRRMEQELRRSEQELRKVLQTMPAMAWVASADGANEFVSEVWIEYTGFTLEDTRGAGWQSALHPDDFQRYLAEWRAAVGSGRMFESEVRLRRASDGGFRWFLGRAIPLRDERGIVVRWYGVLTDIEDRKRSEEERERLHRLEAELVRVSRISTMGELSASLAHELSQPITAVVSSANACLRWLARDPPEIGEARDVAGKIVRDGTRAGQLIQRLRARYQKDASPRREAIALNPIIQEIVGLLHQKAIDHAVSIRTDLAPGLPELRADRAQLQQVLMNLMLNGLEAMESGGEILVRSRLEGGHVSVSVSDTGVGLPPEGSHRLFDAFFTTKPRGSGMGLAISRSIIESHRGRLWAAANEDRGATFHFTLPVEGARNGVSSR